ncbi:DNA topoisomerase III [Ferrovum myxofaciens]|uniref:DNA topoisomerase n=1 Tax=Ferrovum myxofaciens TaxID=416213 RepID=A0A9E6SZ04_9PROT|nr:DNA topoisomerase III [Ferrovum myxofaciens]MBU6993514.1 DNA topoisomerase III [Ferrovum myxofaciens]QKE38009.1 MAG: DNA topoisomerase III [Ferrovum myxofaciens]QKE39999.1 MAG: DNA topoisomerase III [Ferrovum myxofaciens]QWY75709.1 MAG: DNA topoisomerase III [Ferrovum myxofaciens]QWY78441.1 MAG: DNA topoisomerase III [Ferrovum myxofaciens]
MRLFIAEKPSVAKAIAGMVGKLGHGEGYIECSNNTVITWCYGHLLALVPPEEYVGGKVQSWQIPVIPQDWKLSPRQGNPAKQIRTIRELLAKASEVVHAGDADREGQLLVDEVLGYLGWRGKTSRLWLSSLDDESIRRALATIKPNSALRSVYESALARQYADWLAGMNESIAISRNLQALGIPGSWSVGRVQTPTLALLVNRQRAIRAFRQQEHYQVEATLDGSIKVQWQIPEELLGDGLLLERHAADQVAGRVIAQPFQVEKFSSKIGSRASPLPYVLSSLQKMTSSRYGLSAAQTLEAAQELYEAKLTTYPRTDCPYLPVELRDKAGAVLEAIGLDNTDGVNITRTHAAWNTGKVEAHHGIVPTGQKTGMTLSQNARHVFSLICESYVRLFMLPESFEAREAIFLFQGGDRFSATTRIVMEKGWTRYGKHEDDTESVTQGELPVLSRGETRRCVSAEVLIKHTTPTKPFTDGTLIAAMTSIHKLVADPELKKRLRETSGLGTEATRASIIETLIKRDYAKRINKEIHPTLRGIDLIEMVRRVAPEITDPGTTALQEDSLADIAASRATMADFMGGQIQTVRRLSETLLRGKLMEKEILACECPACGSLHCIRLTSKAGKPYHRCPDCSAAFADEKGKPGKRFESSASDAGKKPTQSTSNSGGPKCPVCKKDTDRRFTKTSKPYFRCGGCNSAWWPDNNKLGSKWDAR